MANSWGNDGRLASRRLYVTSSGVNRSLLSYAYDNDDNITGITDGVTPANSMGLGYDVRGRLAQTLWQSGSFAREDIIHDANGNRTAVERRIGANDNIAAQTDSYTRTAGTNRLASITGTFGVRSIIYDARGNTQSESRSGGIAVSTAYDGHGRLISYARTGDVSQTNGYNGMDERVVVTSGTVIRRFVYDPDGRVVGEYGTSATNVIAERIWMTPETNDAGMFGGDDGTGGYAPIAVVIGTTLRWVHANHMGVPQLHTSNTGAIIATPAYTLPGFPGQFRTYADLYYNKYRDYDTTTGRYIQADPIGLAGGQSPYGYAMGSPLRYSDPTGEFAVVALLPPVAAAVIVVGGGYLLYEWWIHNPADDYLALPTAWKGCIFHYDRNRGRGGGIGGRGFGKPAKENGDACVAGWIDETDNYCAVVFSGSAYRRCVNRANDRLLACKREGGRWPPNGPDRWSYQDEHGLRP
jgi:RHS repeat-associated protein